MHRTILPVLLAWGAACVGCGPELIPPHDMGSDLEALPAPPLEYDGSVPPVPPVPPAGDASVPDRPGTPGVVGLHGTTSIVTDAPENSLARAFASGSVEALVQGPNGDFMSFPGTLSPDGHFVTIVTHSPGRYLLRIGNDYTLHDDFDVRADELLLGRPDRVARSDDKSGLSFNLVDADVWKMGDHLELFSAGAGNYLPTAEAASQGVPKDGDDSLNGLLVLPANLVSAARGDHVYLTELTTADLAGGITALGASRGWNGTFEQQANSATAVSGSFTNPPDQTLSLSWLRSQFFANVTQANPRQKHCSDELKLTAQPVSMGQALPVDGTPTLLRLSTGDSAASELTVSAATYGNPYPAEWSTLVETRTDCSVTLDAPGGANLGELSARSWQREPLADVLTAKRVEAPTSGALHPMIAGKDALYHQEGVGKTPTFTWSAPTKGRPTHYLLTLYTPSGDKSWRSFATLSTGTTGATRLTVPPGLLISGGRYAATLAAVDGGYGEASSSGTRTVLGVFSP